MIDSEHCPQIGPHEPHLYDYQGIVFKCQGVTPHQLAKS